MATVTSFEALRHPRRTDLQQFAELFEPLFTASSDEARRQAAAALSQAQNLPESVAFLIGSAPIGIAATFLTRSPAVSDRVLIDIVNRMGSYHAAAIARRDNLSPMVVDALVDRHQSAGGQRWDEETVDEIAGMPDMEDADAGEPHLPIADAADSLAEGQSVQVVSPLVFAETLGPDMDEAIAPSAEELDAERARVQREEALRQQIKALARVAREEKRRSRGLQAATPTNAALLLRFARTGEIFYFRRALAASLEASESLAERILLDVSGRQLALALSALDVDPKDAQLILTATYPHLGERLGITSKADHMVWAADNDTDRARVEAWVRADRRADDGADNDEAGTTYEPLQAPERPADPRRQPAFQRSERPDVSRNFGKRSGGARR